MTKKYALRKVATGVMSVAIGAQLVAGVVSAQDAASSASSTASTSEVAESSVPSESVDKVAPKDETKPSTPAKKVVDEEEAKNIKAELEAAGIPFVEKREEKQGKNGDGIHITYEIQNELGPVTIHADRTFDFKEAALYQKFKTVKEYQEFLKSDRFAFEKKTREELKALALEYGVELEVERSGYFFTFKTMDVVVYPDGLIAGDITSIRVFREYQYNLIQLFSDLPSLKEWMKEQSTENNSSTEATSKPSESNSSTEATSKPTDKPSEKPADKPVDKPSEKTTTDNKQEIGSVAKPTFKTEEAAKQAGMTAIAGKKDVQVVVEKDAMGNWTYKIEPVQLTKSVEQAKPQAKQEAAKPQGKQLPNTGESQGVFAIIGISMMALAVVVAKKFKHNA